jgi:hypothetical protein
MPDEPELIDTLHDTSALLAAARKSIAANGHRQALLPIDRLIAMVERDVDRRLSSLLSRRFRLRRFRSCHRWLKGYPPAGTEGNLARKEGPQLDCAA